VGTELEEATEQDLILLLEEPGLSLHGLSDALTEQGHTGLDPRWVKTPISGSGKLSIFVTLLGANKIHVAVLVDSSTKDLGAVKHLRDNDQLAKDGLLEISQFTGTKDADIEDLLEPDFYLDLVNRAYKQHLTTPITAPELNPHDPRIVRRIETYFRDNNITAASSTTTSPPRNSSASRQTSCPVLPPTP
jgi:hypothetical protein